MTLPKHNRFIRFLYGISIVLMFAILFWYVDYTFSYYNSWSAADSAEIQNTTSPATYATIESQGFTIAGKSMTLSWEDAALAQKLSDFWYQFYATADQYYSAGMTEEDRVYIVYDRYDQDAASFRATIGFKIADTHSVEEHLQSAVVNPGKYATFDNANGNRSITNIWSDAIFPQLNPLYSSDFETYRFDSSGNVYEGKICIAVQ